MTRGRAGAFVLAVLLAVCVTATIRRAAAQPSTSRPTGRRTHVEGVAAFVGGASPGAGTVAILISDVELNARIRLSGEANELPVGPLPAPLLAASLDELVGEALIAREADRLRAARPDDAAVARERARLEERAGGATRLEALLRGIGARVEEVEELARRRAYVDAFLRANLEGSTVVSDAQIQRVYEEGEHPFVERPLEEVREVLRAWLAQQLLRRDVQRWIEVLRSRTEVRTLAPWAEAE